MYADVELSACGGLIGSHKTECYRKIVSVDGFTDDFLRLFAVCGCIGEGVAAFLARRKLAVRQGDNCAVRVGYGDGNSRTVACGGRWYGALLIKRQRTERAVKVQHNRIERSISLCHLLCGHGLAVQACQRYAAVGEKFSAIVGVAVAADNKVLCACAGCPVYGGAASVLLGNQFAVQVQTYLAAVKRADSVVPFTGFNRDIWLDIAIAASGFIDVAVKLQSAVLQTQTDAAALLVGEDVMLTGGRYFVVAEYAFDGDSVRHFAVLSAVKRIHVRIIAAVERGNLLAEIGVLLNNRRADCLGGVCGCGVVCCRAVGEVYVQHVSRRYGYGRLRGCFAGFGCGLICGFYIVSRHGAGVDTRECNFAVCGVFQLTVGFGVAAEEQVHRRYAQRTGCRNRIFQFAVQIDFDILAVIGAYNVVPAVLDYRSFRLSVAAADMRPELQGVGTAFLLKAETGDLRIAERVVVCGVLGLVIQLNREVFLQFGVIFCGHGIAQTVVRAIKRSDCAAERFILHELRLAEGFLRVSLGILAVVVAGEIYIQNGLCWIRCLVALAGGDGIRSGNRVACLAEGRYRLHRNVVCGVSKKVVDFDRPFGFLVFLVVIGKYTASNRITAVLWVKRDFVFVNHVRILVRACCCSRKMDSQRRAVCNRLCCNNCIRIKYRCSFAFACARVGTLGAVGLEGPRLILVHVLAGGQVHAVDFDRTVVQHINAQCLRSNFVIRRTGSIFTGIWVDFALFVLKIRADRAILNGGIAVILPDGTRVLKRCVRVAGNVNDLRILLKQVQHFAVAAVPLVGDIRGVLDAVVAHHNDGSVSVLLI